ncbi:hypothetical protein HYFRA_00013678 [Hymenoscyphus fraxineus]|uniref:Ppx/GppA phosphatase domain-containing protein n=1 Tax=Hymenoscyphus fraxineus TaxID=746836 RepID=A0A9N9LC67_9HELO|nr:hypothetical protein HYFRA_00013678 [Hymenoscyphus fraxineus]
MSAAMGEIITITNFATKMSQFSPEASSTLYGLVDMGSNGIRFSISDLALPTSRALNCIYRERAGISLYDALHESTADAKPFHFSPDTIHRVAQTMARFRKICDGYGVQQTNTSVFATEAMRTAKNRDEMLGAIKEASGLVVDILSPNMESLFGAMGARSGFHHVDGLFMDLGGGSVQMTYVNSTEHPNYDILAAEAATSMPFGAAKLTAALSTQDEGQAAKKELRSLMKETFEGLTSRFSRLKQQAEHDDGITIYFCGGGFRGYGSMLMHTEKMRYPIPAIGGYTTPGERFVKWREMLHVNKSEEGKIYGLSKRRREQFPAIATVVEALVDAVPKIKQVVFCSGGNREGVLYMKLPPELRETNPLSLIPGNVVSDNNAATDTIVTAIQSGMTKESPAIFSSEILKYIAHSSWQEMGDRDSANSAKSLHDPISGSLAGFPGLTHELRAVIALTMCSRWGSDLGPKDKELAESLQLLIGHELSFWCRYVGCLVRMLAHVMPAAPVSEEVIHNHILLKPEVTYGLGKKGHKVGIRLRIELGPGATGLAAGEIEKYFDKIAKGLKVDWKVEAEVTE